MSLCKDDAIQACYAQGLVYRKNVWQILTFGVNDASFREVPGPCRVTPKPRCQTLLNLVAASSCIRVFLQLVLMVCGVAIGHLGRVLIRAMVLEQTSIKISEAYRDLFCVLLLLTQCIDYSHSRFRAFASFAFRNDKSSYPINLQKLKNWLACTIRVRRKTSDLILPVKISGRRSTPTRPTPHHERPYELYRMPADVSKRNTLLLSLSQRSRPSNVLCVCGCYGFRCYASIVWLFFSSLSVVGMWHELVFFQPCL